MPRPEATSWSFEAIGTAWQVDSASAIVAQDRAAVAACIDDYDRTWSRFREDSVISRVARDGGTWTLGPEAAPLLDLYGVLHDLTDGAVNPLVGRALSDLGYDAGYSLLEGAAVAAVPRWDTVVWDAPVLVVEEPALLDVGAAGKGHLVDLVAALLARRGHDDLVVDASGDLLAVGGASVRVALEHPLDVTRAVGVVELAPGRALCASAVNRRAWGDGLHHVLDARTGRPTADVLATWVVADSCLLADGLATALFFADPHHITERFDVSWTRMHADGRIEWSADLPGEVFA